MWLAIFSDLIGLMLKQKLTKFKVFVLYIRNERPRKILQIEIFIFLLW